MPPSGVPWASVDFSSMRPNIPRGAIAPFDEMSGCKVFFRTIISSMGLQDRTVGFHCGTRHFQSSSRKRSYRSSIPSLYPRPTSWYNLPHVSSHHQGGDARARLGRGRRHPRLGRRLRRLPLLRRRRHRTGPRAPRLPRRPPLAARRPRPARLPRARRAPALLGRLRRLRRLDGGELHGHRQAPPPGRLHPRRREHPPPRPRHHRLRERHPRRLQAIEAHRPRRHRSLPPPRRALRLLERQGAPPRDLRREGGRPLLRHGRARDGPARRGLPRRHRLARHPGHLPSRERRTPPRPAGGRRTALLRRGRGEDGRRPPRVPAGAHPLRGEPGRRHRPHARPAGRPALARPQPARAAARTGRTRRRPRHPLHARRPALHPRAGPHPRPRHDPLLGDDPPRLLRELPLLRDHGPPGPSRGEPQRALDPRRGRAFRGASEVPWHRRRRRRTDREHVRLRLPSQEVRRRLRRPRLPLPLLLPRAEAGPRPAAPFPA